MRSCILGGMVLLASAVTWSAGVLATEQIVRNDGLNPPAQGVIVGDFVPNELAGVVLTSPCSGSIVGIQILWLAGGSAADTLEENIYIYNTGTPAGTAQNPGPVLLQLEGPILSPGFLNEFRTIDEGGTVPIDIPVTNGQNFTVALEFGEPTDVNGGSASIVRDTNGCQAGRNFLYVDIGLGYRWYNACSLGVNGDLVIRAIVDCADPTGACCNGNGVCSNNVEIDQCQGNGETFFQGNTCASVTCPEPIGACCSTGGGCLDEVSSAFCTVTLSGFYAGNGTACDGVVCDPGACCKPDGSCADLPKPACLAAGGTYQGGATSCASFSCPQPRGACCVNANCVSNQTQAGCLSFSGTWNGAGSTCTPNPCGSCNDGDVDNDNDVDLKDFAALQRCFNQSMTVGCDCVDMTNDNHVNLSDLPPFSSALNGPH